MRRSHWQVRKAIKRMFEIYGRKCHLCGHGGAGEADHLIPLSVWPDQPADPHGMRPAHGTHYPCPDCGRKCNQERGAKPIEEEEFVPKGDW